MFCWPCCVILVGTVLYIRLLVYAGLSLFIKSGPYVYMVVCVVYAYNLTLCYLHESEFAVNLIVIVTISSKDKNISPSEYSLIDVTPLVYSLVL